MSAPPRPRPAKISALVSDVDGTLVRKDKSLPDANREAVERLARQGVAFAIVSSRPPRGLAPLIEALGVSTLAAGFNGGMIVDARQAVLEQHLLEPDLARRAVTTLETGGAEVWVFSGEAWLIRNPDGARVPLEIRTVQFAPTLVPAFGAALDAAGKIVGVSLDPALLSRCEEALAGEMAGRANVVRSQSYYLDITDRLANKGHAVQAIARQLRVPPEEVCVIGDGANDVAMFEAAGFSIAMGNAEPAVQAAADAVTTAADDAGFAEAVDRYVLTAPH
jgi:Cof subfamily protein (haloacid dehalogenase superfamily)